MRWRLRAMPAVLIVLVALSLTGRPRDRAAEAVVPQEVILLAAGDVAQCTPKNGAELTAKILDRYPTATIAMLGDGAYPDGTLEEYVNCYGPTWGRHFARTRPSTGNHDYNKRSSGGYFKYFGSLAGEGTRGYYSYPLGNWHVVVLNSQSRVGLGQDGGQTKWLQADLAAADADCILAYWHHPRFYSSVNRGSEVSLPSSDRKMTTSWRVLQEYGADVVLASHRHAYERFPELWIDDRGRAAPSPEGIRSFVVGTGGGTLADFSGDDDPHSEAQIAGAFGVLKLTLGPSTYSWEFLDTEHRVLDSGTGSCRSLKAGTAQPTTSSTATTTTTTTPAPQTTAPPTHRPASARSGYWMVGAQGQVYPFGDAAHHGDVTGLPGGARVVDLEPTPSGDGYWVTDSTGRVHARGDARYLGGADGAILSPGETVTSLSATPSGQGYWLFTSRGRVLVFGDAPFLGDMSAVPLNGPVLDSVPTPSGRGYYMVASDGGIFAFGDARFYGSMGGHALNAPVQSLVPDGDGEGYWLVASDGGIFAFDAAFRGSMGGTPLNQPVTGMVRFGDGYLMVASDGGIFNFSERPFHGSLGDRSPAHPIVSVAPLDHPGR